MTNQEAIEHFAALLKQNLTEDNFPYYWRSGRLTADVIAMWAEKDVLALIDELCAAVGGDQP